MKLFALIYTMIDIELSNANRPAHLEFLRRLVAEGKLETGWKFPHYEKGALQGLLICKAGSAEEVTAWFREDPVIATGARTFEVREALPMSV
jgi:uncharacterized protein YciI